MSPNTCTGRSSARDWICTSPIRTSMAPVGRLAFTVSAGRGTTGPVTVSTHSERAESASAKAGLSGSTTHWVMP